MRFVYVDEAGTSAQERVSVVVGIIVHADKQWKLTESKVVEVLKAVPECYKSDFIFHAKTVWTDPKYRQNWSMAERLALLHNMMSIPRLLGLPIALGIVRRTTSPPDNLPPALSEHEFHHLYAFWLCICQADKFLRKRARANELGTVVAEHVPHMWQHLQEVVDFPEVTLPAPQLELSSTDISISTLQEFKITRIVDTIHFVKKEQAPLLQVADACAFGFRRYFAALQFGDDFVNSILRKKWNGVRGDLANPLGLLIRFQGRKWRFFSRFFSQFAS